jgi:hypothetical protein
MLVALIVLSLLASSFFAKCAYREINKDNWDNRITELCRTDGGYTAFETVAVGESSFERHEFFRTKLSDTQGTPYYRVRRQTLLHDADPKVDREEVNFYRTSSKKNIGRSVFYSRVGGDGFILDHPSNFTCVNVPGVFLQADFPFFVSGPYKPELE